MVKTSEYKYVLKVGRRRLVNLGNYENKEYYEELSQGFENKKDIGDVRQFLISEVEESIRGQIEIDSVGSEQKPPEPHRFDVENPDKVIDEGSDWPSELVCYKCKKRAARVTMTYFDPDKPLGWKNKPYKYLCDCGANNYPNWFHELMKEKVEG